MMEKFNFSIPQNFSFGAGNLNLLPDIMKKAGMDHVMLISDRALEKIGLVGRVCDIITAAGYQVTPFLDVEANPSVETVEKAAEAYKAAGAAGIIALGGGAAMDTSKATSVLVTYGGTPMQYVGPNKVPGPVCPLVAIPTTAGTGSEATPVSVISDHVNNLKVNIISMFILPRFVILDPELIYSLPASVAAATGTDAFVHALESYMSTESSFFSHAMAEKALALIGANLRKFYANRSDKDAAAAMMAGSTFAGIAFCYSRLGNVHALSHPISAYCGAAHGVANNLVLIPVLEFNKEAAGHLYKKVYDCLHPEGYEGEFVPDMLIDDIKALLAEMKMPTHLAELGVTEETIQKMAADALASNGTTCNPRATTLQDLVDLYHAAM